MRLSAFKPVGLVMLLNVALAERPPREPVSADFRLVTEVSRTVVRTRLPVTVFANLTNQSEYSWNDIQVAIEASDELGAPLEKRVLDHQMFDSHGSRVCKAVFRFQEPVQVFIRVTLKRGKGTAPFFERNNVARIAVTPVDVTGERTETSNRDGCQ